MSRLALFVLATAIAAALLARARRQPEPPEPVWSFEPYDEAGLFV